MATLETPRFEGPATRVAGPEGNFGIQLPRSEIFLSNLFRFKSVDTEPVRLASATGAEDAPILEKSVVQEAVLRNCRNETGIQAGEEKTPEGIAHREEIRKHLDELVAAAGFNIEGQSAIELWGQRLPHFGWTYNVFIGQSNISIHTYPEPKAVTVSVNVCASEMSKIDEGGRDSILVLFERMHSFCGSNAFYDPANKEHAGRQGELSVIGERREYDLPVKDETSS